MDVWKLIKKLEKKYYPIWKIHQILNLYNVAPTCIINIENHKAEISSHLYKDNLEAVEIYIDGLDNWKK